MKCENIFCIYQKKGECVLEFVDHDFFGNCTECICVEIEESLLNEMKKRCRDSLDSISNR